MNQELFFTGIKEFYNIELGKELSQLINMESDRIDDYFENQEVDLDQVIQRLR